MAGKFEIYQDKAGEYRFNLKAGNNEIVLTGEAYQQKSSCENGIESVRTNAPLDERYEKKSATNGKPYFVLKAANHQIIGQSQMYSSDTARDNGIEAVKRAVDGATITSDTEAEPKPTAKPKAKSKPAARQEKQQQVTDGRSPWLR